MNTSVGPQGALAHLLQRLLQIQAGAELGQAQVKSDGIVEVVVDVEVIGVVKVEV